MKGARPRSEGHGLPKALPVRPNRPLLGFDLGPSFWAVARSAVDGAKRRWSASAPRELQGAAIPDLAQATVYWLTPTSTISARRSAKTLAIASRISWRWSTERYAMCANDNCQSR